MSLYNTEALGNDVRMLLRQYTDTEKQLASIKEDILTTDTAVQSLLLSRARTISAPVANLLWNGEINHSVNTWHDTTASSDDKAKEAAWWFAHNKPAPARNFSTIGTINQIDITAHGYETGTSVDLITTGTLPTGGASPLAVSTPYYIFVVNANAVRLASTLALALAGTPDKTFDVGTGTGTHTVQPLLLAADARTTSVNSTLKGTTHANYLQQYSRWNHLSGWAELTGTSSADCILPTNVIDATTPLARLNIIAAKRNKFIELPSDCLLNAGIWDNTSGEREFLTGSVGFTANVIGTPAQTVERRYRVFITSDKGFSILSNEVTLLNAPKDGFFNASTNVLLGWKQQAGQLQVDIVEFLPNGGTGGGAPEYRLLNQVSASTTYIHQGSFLSILGGYPTANSTSLSAQFATSEGELDLLSTNGVSPSWTFINFPIPIADTYDKSLTTGRQWLRIWLSKGANLFVENITTDGTTTILAAEPAFEAEYDALFDAGNLTVQVFDSNDTLIATTTVVSRTDDTHLVLGTAIIGGTGRKIRIVGGGFHGILFDKVNLGYQQNTSFTPNPFDTRSLPPAASPTQSTQGGDTSGSGGGETGGGTGTGGGISCVAGGTLIKMHEKQDKLQIWRPIEKIRPGERIAAAAVFPNILVRIKTGVGYTRIVRSRNGCEIECTDTERFVVSPDDSDGTPLFSLRTGDSVLTEINGRIEPSEIVLISSHSSEKKRVYTPSLSGSKIFIGGTIAKDALFWKWLLRRIQFWRKETNKTYSGGFVLHNLKPLD